MWFKKENIQLIKTFQCFELETRRWPLEGDVSVNMEGVMVMWQMWCRSLRFAAARKELRPAAGSEGLLGDGRAGEEARPRRHSRGSGTVDPGKGLRVPLPACVCVIQNNNVSLCLWNKSWALKNSKPKLFMRFIVCRVQWMFSK